MDVAEGIVNTIQESTVGMRSSLSHLATVLGSTRSTAANSCWERPVLRDGRFKAAPSEVALGLGSYPRNRMMPAILARPALRVSRPIGNIRCLPPNGARYLLPVNRIQRVSANDR